MSDTKPDGTSSNRMRRYPREYIDDLCAAADIVGIIGQHTDLFPQGNDEWIGCCPFHNDTHPSFSVNAKKGVYLCFACHVKGNIITFLMEKENMGFREAIRHLEAETGLRPPSPEEIVARAFKIDGSVFPEEPEPNPDNILYQVADLCGTTLKQAWENPIVYKRIMKIFKVVDDAYAIGDTDTLVNVIDRLNGGLLKWERLTNAGR